MLKTRIVMKYFLLFLLSMLGCRSNSFDKNVNAKKSTSLVQIKSYHEKDKLIFSNHYEPLYTIKLGPSIPLVGEIDKVLFFDKYIFVLDQNGSQELFVFDTTGNFKFTVGKKGLGPGEHEFIEDFSVNENHIVILTSNKTLLWYNLHSNSLERTTTLPIYPESISKWDKKGLLLSTNFIDNNPNKSHILEIDSTGNIIKGLIPIENNNLAGITSNKIFPCFKSTILYVPTQGKKMYSIANENCQPIIDLDNEVQRWAGKRLTKNTKFASGEIIMIPNLISFYTYTSDSITNLETMLYWNYINTTTGAWYSYDGIEVDWFPMAIEGHPKGQKDDSLLVWPMYADGIEAFLELIKEDKQYKEKLMKNDFIAANIIKNHNENNNPILLIGRWKN